MDKLEKPFIHGRADVQTDIIGAGTVIWQYAVVCRGARIGRRCNVNCHTFIEGDVVLGDNVTVKSGTYLWNGLSVEDDVFFGPNVTITNDKYPRSRVNPPQRPRTHIRKGASLGAGAIIMGGVVIGAYSLIGAGSLVTRDVPDFAMVKGAPAVICGWVDKDGDKLKETAGGKWMDKEGTMYEIVDQKLTSK